MKTIFLYIITCVLIFFSSCRIVESYEAPESFPAKRRVIEQVNIVNNCINNNVFYFYISDRISKWKEISDTKEMLDFESKYLSQFRLVKINDTINLTPISEYNNDFKRIKIIAHKGLSLYDKESRWEIESIQKESEINVNLLNLGNSKFEIVCDNNKYMLGYKTNENQLDISLEGGGNILLSGSEIEKVNDYAYNYDRDTYYPNILNILFKISKTIKLQLDLNSGYKSNSFLKLMEQGEYCFEDLYKPQSYDVVVEFKKRKYVINYRGAKYNYENKRK